VTTLNPRVLSASLYSHRYSELEKAIQRETDTTKRAKLVRDLNYAQRTGRSTRA
jgi:hypothetical protein